MVRSILFQFDWLRRPKDYLKISTFVWLSLSISKELDRILIFHAIDLFHAVIKNELMIPGKHYFLQDRFEFDIFASAA